MSETAQKFLMLGYGVVAFFLVIGVVLLAADRAPKRGKEKWQIALFIGPTLILAAVGLIIPAVRTTLLAFKDSYGKEWVGADNFVWMFTSPDARPVLLNTVVWVLLTPFLATAVGLLYSILVDGSRFESAYKALVFLPMAISMVGASIIWKFVYDYRGAGLEQTGLLNQVLVWLGIEPMQLLLDWPLNTILLIVILIWIQAGYAMVVLSAAIKSIPADIVEAARLDGVNPIQMFFRITVPSIQPAILVVYITILIATLKVFDIVRTMTGGRFNTSVIANEMYSQVFVQNQDGQGSALAVFLFLLVLPVVVYQIRQLRRERMESR
ncbi:MAG: alpha-glucoside transport system permease protein [Actinomycetota bacterium]|nr:alpha-glucoside transport system permease protein [Actinomycetota bacterium]